MENKEQTLITAIKSVITNQPLNIDCDEFNNDYTLINIFKKYTDQGATLITGLNCNYYLENIIFRDVQLSPNRLTASFNFDINNIEESELIDEIKQEVIKEFEIKYNNELSSNKYENLIIGIWQMNLTIDNITLKEEDKLILIINLYIDVISKQNN